MKSELLPPPSTMKSLRPLYDILETASNLKIDYSSHVNMIDSNYHNHYHKQQVDFNSMSKD